MIARIAALTACIGLPALAVDSEWTRLSDSCGAFKVLPCATTLFTDHPFHIAVGSLAPGNGFAAGPALSFTHHTKPKHIPGPDGDTVTHWRLNWDADAVLSNNLSWRAGLYMKARYTKEPPTVVVDSPAPAKGLDLRPQSWLFNTYVQAESLNTLTYYGIGQDTSRSAIAFYRMRQTIVGGNALIPLWSPLNLSMFGEANGRFVSLRPDNGETGPSIEQIYNSATAPGLGDEKGYAQFGQGVRLAPAFGNHFSLNYAVTYQEFISPSQSSFQRLVFDLNHQFDLYGTSEGKAAPDFNGPNSCAHTVTDRNAACPAPALSKNLEGSISFRFLMNQSFVNSSNVVPFYFQPTLGGGNINGESLLPSYADYRFRGPTMILYRASFEHSIGKLPIGFLFMADEAKVALTPSDVGFNHLAHSFSTGLTVHAGGFPVLSVLFSWGGHEGTHNLAQVSSSLLGGGARPSLY
jgi:hypothetical protein